MTAARAPAFDFSDGLEALQAGRPAEAEFLFDEQLEAADDRWTAMSHLAALLMKHSFLDAALATCQREVDERRRAGARSSNSECNLLAFHAFRQDMDTALALADEIIATWPDHANARLKRALLRYQTRQLKPAIDDASAAVIIDRTFEMAWDALAHWLGIAGRHDEAVQAGRKVLAMKDERVCKTFATYGQAGAKPGGSVPPFEPRRPERNAIAYSLWGNDPSYTEILVLNARIQPHLYPGWHMRVYHDDTVPASVLARLSGAGVRLIPQPPAAGTKIGLLWRFAVADDPGVDRYIVRDADSLLTVQERVAVDAWIASGRRFHVMRDFYSHTDLILAGLWGGITGAIPGLYQSARRYFDTVTVHDRKLDQNFLNTNIWPLLKQDVLIHDTYFGNFGAVLFPDLGRLPAGRHVGQSQKVTRRSQPGKKGPTA